MQPNYFLSDIIIALQDLFNLLKIRPKYRWKDK